jgi:hypothetical protein
MNPENNNGQQFENQPVPPDPAPAQFGPVNAPTLTNPVPPPKPSRKFSPKVIGIIAGAVILVVAIIIVVFVLLGGKSETEQQTQNGSPLSESAKTSDHPWKDYWVGRIGFIMGREVAREDNLYADVSWLSSETMLKDGKLQGEAFYINVGTWDQDGKESATGPAHQVSVSNVEYMAGPDHKIFKVGDNLYDDGKSDAVVFEFSTEEEFLKSYRSKTTYWQEQHGRALTVKDVYMGFSEVGKSIKIGESTGRDKDEHDVVRHWALAVNWPKNDGNYSIDAIKFDWTVDGKTKTVAWTTNKLDAYDCKDSSNSSLAAWNKFLRGKIGNASSRSHALDCRLVSMHNLAPQMNRIKTDDTSTTTLEIRIEPEEYSYYYEQTHDITIDNLEYMTSDGKTHAAKDDLKQDAALFADYLTKEKAEYDRFLGDRMHLSEYQQKVFGRNMAFDEVYLDASKIGTAVKIGPTIDSAVDFGDYARTWYLAIDSKDIIAVKFDVIIDDKTTSIAFEN